MASLLVVVFALGLTTPSTCGSRGYLAAHAEGLPQDFTGLIFLDFLNVNASVYYADPGAIVHIYVEFSVTWTDYGSFWVEARYNGSAIDRKSYILIGSGTATDTIDFAWNTSGLEPGSYLITAAASTHSSYEDGYVRIVSTHTVPDDYAAIQAAVNAANEGDIVFVRNGTYDEYLNVTKRLVIFGESMYNTTVIGFEICADHVAVSGFTMNAGSYVGVTLDNARHCNISHNVVIADFYAIALVNSSDNYLVENRIPYSINGWGIFLMIDCNDNNIHRNSISQQEVGIYLLDSHNNTLDGNTLSDNYLAVYVDGSLNRIYHNNLVNNRAGVVDFGGNSWDNGCEGNYWSDYRERYPSASFDLWGIGDTPYRIDEANQDNCPLMNLYWNPGDTDHDLDVDIFDIVKVCHFYAVPYWSDDCCHVDVAEPYGVIDIFDVVMIAISYGEEYNP